MTTPTICLAGPPFCGHINPLLGIGIHLSKSADVTIVSTPSAMEAVRQAGLKGHAVLAGRENLIHEIVSPGREVKNHPLLLYRQLKANVSMQLEMLGALEAAFASIKPDLVIADFTIPVAGIAARGCGARWWTTTPAPCVYETPDGPPAYCGGLRPATTPAGRARERLLRAGVRGFKRLMFQLFRKTFTRAGITSVYREDGTERVYSPERVLALGMKELEFPRTYPAQFQFIGPVLYNAQGTGPAPVFEAGRKHVLVSIGTHLDHFKEGLAGHLRALAKEHGEMAFHFTDGRPGGDSAEQDGNFHRYSFVSYEDYLKRYDLVIHHCGTGIMYHCLKHGIPSIVLPLDFDQFDNAARLESAGACVRINKPGEIKTVLRRALHDAGLSARCRQLAGCMADYHPEEAISGFIEKL